MQRAIPAAIVSFLLLGCGSSTPSSGSMNPPPPPPPPTPHSVSVSPATLTLEVGQGGNLSATVRDADDATISATVTWSSSAPAIATVSSSGRVTGVAQGSATITAIAGTVGATASVTVNPVPVASVAIAATPPELEIGNPIMLVATPRSATGATLTGRTVTWSTSNPAFATVGADGTATGTGAGTVTITAMSEGQSASVTFEVGTRAALLAAILDSIRTAYNTPALGAAITTRSALFGVAAAGKRRMSLPEMATANDLWHIGSNLKAITAHVAAMAVESGAISWNTTLAEAYPEFAGTMLPAYQAVTLRMLLGHIGGIAPNVEDQNIPGTGTLTEQRANIAGWATSIAPIGPIGQYSYSNVGFMIAANMVERAMATSWEAVMQNLLLGPLGITEFGWGAAPWQQNQNPIGHKWTGGGWVENASDNPPYHSAAGRAHLSLTAWARMMQDILQADQGMSPLVGQANARVVTTAIAPNGYAGGWSTLSAPWSQGRGLEHDGSNTWHYSRAQVALDRGAAIVVVTNFTEPAGTRHIDSLAATLNRLWIYFTDHGS